MASKTWSAERILLTEAAEPVDVVDLKRKRQAESVQEGGSLKRPHSMSNPDNSGFEVGSKNQTQRQRSFLCRERFEVVEIFRCH